MCSSQNDILYPVSGWMFMELKGMNGIWDYLADHCRKTCERTYFKKGKKILKKQNPKNMLAQELKMF